ncbi:conserved hypothetical protein [Frankia sp. AiPs1]|uniref:hypothetical protein n=1 Tax=Frankia sp. AiPa1 TaxID=573492 RepID=UPI00202BA450|nr:hypothetical protein [Frankia sp. AiPa1]MCL9762305.1 hypothetical protein [Frankia sp. AiPa1]
MAKYAPGHRAPAVPDRKRASHTFRAQALDFGANGKLRDECWKDLDRAVKARIEARTGPIQAWWAIPQSDDERIKAVAFGPGGLCLAEPTIRTDHSPAYRLNSYVAREGSLRRTPIEHRPPPAPRPARGRGRGRGADQALTSYLPPPQAAAAPPIALGQDAARAFGYLPAHAQHLLQEPFLHGQEMLRTEWHYEGRATDGWPSELSNYTFVLAGPAQVTVAAGTMIVPAGHTAETAHWSLVCYRADVARRIGR